ncbi:MAG: hypothetical protein QOJ42_4627 [Acidobacteriaceae bacterium]|jgi:hypothetical protein|nr:hypothetical protein [Acidobacteriaceae bacterium]
MSCPRESAALIDFFQRRGEVVGPKPNKLNPPQTNPTKANVRGTQKISLYRYFACPACPAAKTSSSVAPRVKNS